MIWGFIHVRGMGYYARNITHWILIHTLGFVQIPNSKYMIVKVMLTFANSIETQKRQKKESLRVKLLETDVGKISLIFNSLWYAVLDKTVLCLSNAVEPKLSLCFYLISFVLSCSSCFVSLFGPLHSKLFFWLLKNLARDVRLYHSHARISESVHTQWDFPNESLKSH